MLLLGCPKSPKLWALGGKGSCPSVLAGLDVPCMAEVESFWGSYEKWLASVLSIIALGFLGVF